MTPAGGVLSEFTVARLAEDRAYLTSAAAARQIDWDVLRSMSDGVELKDVTEDIAVIGLMGPRAKTVLTACTDDSLDFPWLSCGRIFVAGHAATALRVSFVGEFGWELHVPAAAAPDVYVALAAAGRPHGIGYYGLYAANSMRLEKGYRAWGTDLTTERSPVEAGLNAFIKAPSHAITSRTNDWEMVLLEIEDPEAHPFYAHGVWQGGRSVGIVTSAAYGHRVGKSLALAYLRDRQARENLEAEILGRRVPVRILNRPPFDPDNARLRGDPA